MKSTEPWLIPSNYGACACTQLRRTARKISAYYDRMLQVSGLTVTQYALLVYVARAGQVSRTALANQLGMDRTTLTRNLIPLERSSLIASAKSADLREHLIRLSPKGVGILRQSYTLWENAQKGLVSQMGAAPLTKLRAALKSAETAAEILTKSLSSLKIHPND
jgi:DNA-binding MarR family transcriptional regulator